RAHRPQTPPPAVAGVPAAGNPTADLSPDTRARAAMGRFAPPRRALLSRPISAEPDHARKDSTTMRSPRSVLGLLACLLLALPAARAAAQENAATPPAARPEDVASVDAIIAALYDVISGPAGQARDWDRFRSLFLPGARLIATGKNPQTGAARHVAMDAQGYVERAGPGLERDGFFEREIGRREDRFGNIAHVFSTYESLRT